MLNQLVDHFFRHESGKLIASLVRFFGIQHIDLVEDMVQSAIVEGLKAWRINGVPDQPAAWIRRVAKNKVLDTLRRNSTFQNKAQEIATATQHEPAVDLDSLFDESQLNDSQLRLIFACCHSCLSADQAIPLTLKTLCGFSEEEIARGMLVSRDNVRKRIYRAKQTMIEQNVSLALPSSRQMPVRLHFVHNVLYLMFNEGYSSTNNDRAIRDDVCEEAARLCHLLTEHPHCSTKTTHALLALMLFHASRFDARLNREGEVVLLKDQDRSLWDQRMIKRGKDYLHFSGQDAYSLYHLEAAIALQHCISPSFDQTNWSVIIQLYDRLIASVPSAIYRFNRAIAVGQRDGPIVALKLLDEIAADPILQRTHLLDAAYGELHRANGNSELAFQCYQRAFDKSTSKHEQVVLRRRMDACDSKRNLRPDP